MKTGTKRAIFSVGLLIVLIAASFALASIEATRQSPSPIKRGQTMQWLVTSSSNVTTMWYSETFSPRGNFTAPLGSTINLTITSTSGGRFRGDLSVGHLALNNTSMPEISFNLLLGWYPFQPGLICPTNWNVQKQNATGNGLTVRESKIGGLNAITFTHLLGNNGTILVYDEATGLLLSGYGAFGRFLIEVTLVNTSADLGLVQSNYSLLLFISSVIVIVAVASAAIGVVVLRERSKERKPRK
ncbi:MAG: hypothetical protein WED04_12705 [Promethearchaeati archaeon SRVP18_Atabeyarchaeia-1]